MNTKLCIGDVVKVIDGYDMGFGVVTAISFDTDDYGIVDIDDHFGQGLEIEKIEMFAIIPNCSIKYAWYKPKDLIEIVVSAEKYYQDITY